jgi:lipoprotein-releasing system permease protein
MAEAAASPAAPRRKGARPFSGYEFMLALRYLRARKRNGGATVIAILSFLGIMLAIAALITVMSVMNGFRHELLTRLLGVQPHVYVYLSDASVADALSEAINDVPGVRQAGPVIVAQGLLTSASGGAAGVQVIGVRPRDLARFDIITGEGDAAEAGGGLVQGAIDSFGEGRLGGDAILIGSGVAAQLRVGAGDPVSLLAPDGASTPMGTAPRRKTYYADGIISMGVLDLDRVYVFMPIEQAAVFFNRPDGVDYIDVRLTDPDRPEAAMERIRQIAPPGSVLRDWREENRAFWNALQVERNLMRLILSIVVAIAAMNIIAGLVMLVKNKTRDIAILRTMGATQASVMRIFLISGAAIGVLGTIAGIVLGVLLVTFIGPIQDGLAFVFGVDLFDPTVYMLYRLPARMDLGELVFVSLWGFLTAILTTVIPSWAAGRIDPVVALRNE